MFKALCLVLLATAVVHADIDQCIEDVEGLIPVVKAIAADIEAGDYTQAIADVEGAIPEIKQAIADCYGREIAPGISAQCMTDLMNLLPTLEQVVADVEAGDWMNVINDVLNAVPQVEAAVADCTAGQYAPEISAQCMTDLMNLLPDLQQLVADVEAGDWVAVMNDAISDLPAVEAAIADCTAGQYAPEISAQCMTDLMNLLPTLEKIVADVEAGDWVQVINDVLNAVPQVEAAVADCTAGQYAPEISAQCMTDLMNLLPDLQQLVADVEAGDWVAVMNDAISDLPAVEAAIADCTAGEYAPEISAQCMTDLMNLLPTLEKVVADVEAGDWTNVINDVLNAVPQVEAAVADCTATQISLDKVVRGLQSETCIQDLLACLPYLKNIVDDIDSGDYIKLISDALAAVTPLENAVDACLAEGKAEFQSGQAEATPANCVSDVEALVTAVKKVIADMKAGNSWEIDAVLAVMDATHAYGDCSTVDPIALLEYIYTLLTPDEQACVNSVVEVGSSGYKLVTDVKSGAADAKVIINDVTAIIDGIDAVVNTCPV